LLLADPEKKKQPLRAEGQQEEKPSAHSSLWTVMILRGVGKTLSFRISSRILLWSSLFVLLYFLSSVIIFKDYFDKVSTNKAQSGRLNELNHQIDDTERALFQARQRVALLEGHISRLQDGFKKQGKEAESKDGPELKNISRKKADPAPKKVSAGEAASEPRKGLVERKEETKLTVDFQLVKVSSDFNPVSGYVHIIAINKGVDPPQLWSHPKVALRNGVPVDYKQGQPFSIRRLKPFQSEFFVESKAENPSSVEVLVYNESGELIFDQEFDLKDI
jgi:hypothetical protein